MSTDRKLAALFDKGASRKRMTNRRGWTVDAVILNAKPVFRVRDPYGYHMGYFETPDGVQQVMGVTQFRLLKEVET